MEKRILILGATGFIGRNMVEYFMSKSDVELYGTYCKSSSLSIPGVRMMQVDLTNKNDVNRVIKGMDVVIQAAAVTSGAKDIVHNPHYHITDNAIMNSLIFRSAFENSIPHIVFFSCSIMYHSSDKPLKEIDFDANREMYPNYFGGAWNKVYLEKMCEFYSRLGRNRYTVIRHSNIYGPYDKFDLKKSHVFGATMTKVMTAENNKITVWGSGEEERDLLYISDLARFVEMAIDKQQNAFELFNAGFGEAITVKELVRKIVACSGKMLDIEHDLSKPSIKTRLCLDSTKAGKELGWEPQVSLDDGIKKTMDWYQTYL
tara:strand:- start:836 stop:1783 length:948 start_codon:yes stop_codon:yes gene_type:complete